MITLKNLFNKYFLKKPDIGIIFHENIQVNIGGTIFYLPKTFLEENFHFFTDFFAKNGQLDPDYTSILIDRCGVAFNHTLYYIKDLTLAPYMDNFILDHPEIYLDLNFYGYKHDLSVFIDVSSIKYFRIKGHYYHSQMFSMPISSEYTIETREIFLCKVQGKVKRIHQHIKIENRDIELLMMQDKIIYDKTTGLLWINLAESFKLILENLSVEFVKIGLPCIPLEVRFESTPLQDFYQINFVDKSMVSFSLDEIVKLEDTAMVFPYNKTSITKNYVDVIFTKLKFSPKNISHVELRQDSKLVARTNLKMNTTQMSTLVVLSNEKLGLNYYLETNSSYQFFVFFEKKSSGILYLQYDAMFVANDKFDRGYYLSTLSLEDIGLVPM